MTSHSHNNFYRMHVRHAYWIWHCRNVLLSPILFIWLIRHGCCIRCFCEYLNASTYCITFVISQWSYQTSFTCKECCIDSHNRLNCQDVWWLSRVFIMPRSSYSIYPYSYAAEEASLCNVYKIAHRFLIWIVIIAIFYSTAGEYPGIEFLSNCFRS